MVKDARIASINLPVEFRCIAPKARWVCGRAKLLKIRIDRPSGNVSTLVEVLGPSEHVGKKLAIDLSDLPVAILEQLDTEANSRRISFWPSLTSAMLATDAHGGTHIEIVHSDLQFEVVIGTYTTTQRQSRQVDLDELENTFRGLNEKDVRSLAAFLRRFGPWSNRYDPNPEGGVDDVSQEFEPPPPYQIAHRLRIANPSTVIVVPEMIWRERRRLDAEIQMASNDAYFWFSLNALPARFESRSEFPHYVLTDHYCLDALRTKIALNLLKGERYAICARAKCRAPFIPHGKQLKYHHPDCGRIVSREEDRKRKKAALAKGRAK